jgi:Rrf2 family protein
MGGVMLSSKAKYGLKAMIYLARHEGQGPSLIADIAEREHIPKKFLDAILLELKNQGLLSSKKGKGGGYILARPSSRITVGEIIRILDGPLAPIPCVSRTAYRRCDDCDDEDACALRAVMQEVRDALAAILDNTSLSDMISRSAASEPILNYDI